MTFFHSNSPIYIKLFNTLEKELVYEDFRKPTGKNSMIEFLFSNATGLSTAKDIFSDSFLKLSGEIISGAIEFSAD